VPQAIAECEQLIAAGLIDRQGEGNVLCTLAQLRAMNGEIEEARPCAGAVARFCASWAIG
jgi:hypothetical protein